MTSWCGIDDDARKALFVKRVAEDGEGEHFVDSWWCELKQVPEDRTILLDVDAATNEAVEQRVDTLAVLIANSFECCGGVHLSNDEARWVVECVFDVGHRP